MFLHHLSFVIPTVEPRNRELSQLPRLHFGRIASNRLCPCWLATKSVYRRDTKKHGTWQSNLDSRRETTFFFDYWHIFAFEGGGRVWWLNKKKQIGNTHKGHVFLKLLVLYMSVTCYFLWKHAKTKLISKALGYHSSRHEFIWISTTRKVISILSTYTVVHLAKHICKTNTKTTRQISCPSCHISFEFYAALISKDRPWLRSKHNETIHHALQTFLMFHHVYEISSHWLWTTVSSNSNVHFPLCIEQNKTYWSIKHIEWGILSQK